MANLVCRRRAAGILACAVIFSLIALPLGWRTIDAALVRNAAAVAIQKGLVRDDKAELRRGYTLAADAAALQRDSDSAALLVSIAAMGLHAPREAIAVLAPASGGSFSGRLRSNWLARAFDDVGESDDATRAWVAAGRSDVAVRKASALVEARDFRGALREYDRILGVIPGLQAALAGKGNVALAMEDWPNVAAYFGAVLAQDPADALSLVGLGLSIWHLEGNYAHSVALINRAVAAHPTCAWCYANLAQVEAQAGHAEASAVASSKAQQLGIGKAKH